MLLTTDLAAGETSTQNSKPVVYGAGEGSSLPQPPEGGDLPEDARWIERRRETVVLGRG